MSFLTAVRTYVDAMVHPTAQADVLTAARHRAFIAPRIFGSLLALAGFPVYVALRGAPTVLEAGLFAWLLAPILLALYLSRTGRFEYALVLSSALLAALITGVALVTGGIGSFAAVCLVVVPLEAALAGSRRAVIAAALIMVAAIGVLVTAGTSAPALPMGKGQVAPAALGIILASLYATGLALSAKTLAHTGARLLDANDDRYHLLARNMTDVIVRHGKSGTALFVSPAAECLFGAAVDDLTGHGLFDRVHVADRPAYLTAIADAASGRDSRSVEFRVRQDGAGTAPRFVWVEMRCKALESGNEKRATRGGEVVAVLRDVSERKTQEQAVEIARAESERANAAKSRFLATMSHELRTPLNAIIGFSDMLTNESLNLDTARRAEYAKLINESGRHLLSVVNGILDMSKMETGNFTITPEPFEPGPAILSCADLLALKAHEAGVDLRTRVPTQLPELVADRRALNQILINLISNAIKFTPRDGIVTVAATQEADKLAVSVEDTGVGIGRDDLQRVGEAFFQARSSYDRSHDGSGLGLSIVKGLVRLHGGAVDIRSKLGEGTCVTIRLPLESGERRAAAPVALTFGRAENTAGAPQQPVKKIA